MHSVKIEPKYSNLSNPRVGLIALATDFRIEKETAGRECKKGRAGLGYY